MCFSSHTTAGNAIGAIRVERLIRMFEQVRRRSEGASRTHRRRQVDKPPRIDREPTHYFQCRRGVLLAYADPLLVARLEHTAARDIGDVEDLWLSDGITLAMNIASGLGWKGLSRLVIHAGGGNETSSRSGQRIAVSRPPNTQPVSMQMVLLIQWARAGVWP